MVHDRLEIAVCPQLLAELAGVVPEQSKFRPYVTLEEAQAFAAEVARRAQRVADPEDNAAVRRSPGELQPSHEIDILSLDPPVPAGSVGCFQATAGDDAIVGPAHVADPAEALHHRDDRGAGVDLETADAVTGGGRLCVVEVVP